MKFPKLNKKGQVFDNVSGIMIGLVTVALVAVVVFLIVSSARDTASSLEGIDFTADNVTSRASITYNATATINESVDSAISFVPIIVITAIGAVLLGLVALFRRR